MLHQPDRAFWKSPGARILLRNSATASDLSKEEPEPQPQLRRKLCVCVCVCVCVHVCVNICGYIF